MTGLIKDKEKINKIIFEKIMGKRLIFTDHYLISSTEKGIDDEKVKNIFYKFDKIYAIEKETLKFGDIGYELFYELDDNTYFSIATIPKKDILLIVHAVEYKRDLSKRFKEK